MNMRCNNCLWFPMEVEKNPETIEDLICPNCGHTHLEGIAESFIRKIYTDFVMDSSDGALTKEGFDNWNKQRDFLLSDKVYNNYK